MYINGEKKDLTEKNLKKVIESEGFDITRIAVEVDGEIIPKSEYETTVLTEESKVEVISFVGGG